MVTVKSKSNLKTVYGIMAVFLIIAVIVVSTLKGKEPLPPHIEKARVNLNQLMDEVATYEENNPYSDNKTMYGKYLNLQEQTNGYKKLLSGVNLMDRYNYDFERIVNERTQHYLGLAIQINSRNNSRNNSHTCRICNKQFYGNGYQEVSWGNWKPCKEPYQCFICSPDCGNKNTKTWNDIYRDNNIKHSNNTRNQDYYKGSDGRVYENKACSLCKGTGWEKGKNFITGRESRRICPMCKGRGKRSY